MNDFYTGFHYFLEGLDLIFKPGLKRFVFVPLLINIAIFISVFFLLQHYLGEFNLWFSTFLPTWLSWINTLLWLIFLISFVTIFIYLAVTITNIIASPFNSLLAEKVELYLTGKKVESKGLLANVKDVPRIIGRQLEILMYYFFWAICILFLFLIPFIHLFAVIVWFLFNSWYLTLTYMDYPSDNHRIPLNQLRHCLKKKSKMSLGFGIAILFFSMIPILNFFVIPAAIAAATKLWVNEFGMDEVVPGV